MIAGLVDITIPTALNVWNEKDLTSKRIARVLRSTLSLALAMNIMATPLGPEGIRLIDAQRVI
jgi:hypothetical protein